MAIHPEHPASILVTPWESASPAATVRFSIDHLIGVGGASYCYEAYHQNSGRGVLKEFWPSDIPALARGEDGQACCLPGQADADSPFSRRMNAYVQSYRTMLEIRQGSDPSAREFASFIPPFEIYRGCSPAGEPTGTAYIWIPLPEYVTFDRICDGIRAAPEEKSQHKLVLVLKSMAELAGCTAVLHRQGLLHRDIKPANLGFMMRNEQLLEQTLAFFDLDSLCSCYHVRDIVYSEGFSDPDVLCRWHRHGMADDLYAIGATLFHALALTPDAAGYNDACYPYLLRLAEASPLIRACRRYANPKLVQQLTQILQRCLGPVRYMDCGQLQRDLLRALQYIMPVKPDDRGQWVWREAARQLDKRKHEQSKLALQYHLYRHPLYQCSGGEQLNVLILGFGYYGQTFMDSCLQIGQLPGRRLTMTVVSDDPLDRQSYLNARPALCQFVNVDGSLEGDPGRYADIRFIRQRLLYGRTAGSHDLEEALATLFARLQGKDAPHYVMIALGDDEFNRLAAEKCRELLCPGSSIHFVQEGDALPRPAAEGLYPIQVNEDVRKHKAYADLERMAFNTHLVWEKTMAVDFRQERKAFRQQEDNHLSSMDYVLALKGKLFSLSIDLDACTCAQAAAKIEEQLHGTDSLAIQSIRNTLICLEHRRWVLEKVCGGWRAITDMDECVRMGNHQDKAARRHACICRSEPNLNLALQYCRDGQPIAERWDGTNPAFSADLPLDELDAMSLALHRANLRAARQLKQQGWTTIGKPAIDRMNQLLEPWPDALQTWKEFRACMIDIWHGEQKQTFHYSPLKQALERQLSAVEQKLPEGTARKDFLDLAEANLRQLDIVFRPLLASAAYRDFKDEDVKLVDEIPFILTFATPFVLAVPYVTGSSSMLFRNVAAALKANPTQLVFLHHCGTMQDVEGFTSSIGRVVRLLRRKNITAALDICVTCQAALARGREMLEAAVKALPAQEAVRLTVAQVDSDADAAAFMRQHLKRSRKHGVLCALEENDSSLARLLRGAGLYDAMPHYSFDAASMTFSRTKDCPMFGYIRKAPFLSVADIVSLADSESSAGVRPEFFDTCRDLWRQSRSARGEPWRQLCRLLRDYADSNDVVAVFGKEHPAAHESRYTYTISSHSFASADKILKELTAHRIISEKSGIAACDTESCRVTIHDRFSNQPAFNDLFRDQSRLFLTDSITLNTAHNVSVLYDDSVVMNLDLGGPNGPGQTEQTLQLLRYLRDRGFICCYTESGGHVSFSYASRAVKQLLTSEGRILERYVYHKLKASFFDDVVCDYDVSRCSGAVRDRFDCIAAKGFRSLFIACSAQPELRAAQYSHLAELTRQFSVNAKAVLIADTREGAATSAVNAARRAAGAALGVTTVWKEDEIEQIDQTLLSILEGTYHPQ